MKFEQTDTWQPIQDPDMTKRTPQEWAKIYEIELADELGGWWSEYEWAYNMENLAYYPLKKDKDGIVDWDSISEKELRAQSLKRDLFLGADIGEKDILKKQYMETAWIRSHTLRV